MSLISTSIDLLKTLIKPKKIAAQDVSILLESIHGSLLEMARKESELLPKQDTSHDLTPEISLETLSEPSVQKIEIADLQPSLHDQFNTGATVNRDAKQMPESPSDISVTGITEDAIICLICGTSKRRLCEHLKVVHQIDDVAYRLRFNLPPSIPLVALSLSRQISAQSRARMVARLAKKAESKSAEPMPRPAEISENFSATPMESNEAHFFLTAQVDSTELNASKGKQERDTAKIKMEKRPASKSVATKTQRTPPPKQSVQSTLLLDELRAWQKQQQLTQVSVAAKLGISQSFMSKIFLLRVPISPSMEARIRDLIHG
ncbi:MAG: MucR family transcriptional regulator [Magnetococcus sp. DMHC-6]